LKIFNPYERFQRFNGFNTFNGFKRFDVFYGISVPYSLFLIPYLLFKFFSPTVETVGYRKYLNDEKFEMKIISQHLNNGIG